MVAEVNRAVAVRPAVNRAPVKGDIPEGKVCLMCSRAAKRVGIANLAGIGRGAGHITKPDEDVPIRRDAAQLVMVCTFPSVRTMPSCDDENGDVDPSGTSRRTESVPMPNSSQFRGAPAGSKIGPT